MLFPVCALILVNVIYKDTNQFTVHGPSAPLVAPLGSSVVLPCYVENSSITEKVRVVWRRTDSEALVHLYQDGEIQSDAQQQDYHDRAHFFTDKIQHGNFSLHLDDLRAEDEGEYRCKVYTQDIAEKVLVEINVVHLLVSGSDESISAYVDEDVTLNCSVDSQITPEQIEKVSWKKMHEDGDILVLLYQDNKTVPQAADERYRDRVEFFTAEIPKGNFSLRLKSVRTDDKGVYMCQMFAGDLLANATVELLPVGFTAGLITALILCLIASVSTLLLTWLVYNRSENEETKLCLLLCPHITMLLAFITWGSFEGSWYETVSCCVFYILQPLRLFCVSPDATDIQDTILKYPMMSHTDHAALMAVIYLVLLDEHVKDINAVMRIAAFGLSALMCLLFITQLIKEKLLSCCGGKCRRIYSTVEKLAATCSFSVLPSLELTLILSYIFALNAAITITAFPVLPVIYLICHFYCNRTERATIQYLRYLEFSVVSLVIVMSGILLCLYIMILQSKKDGAGLVCVAGLVQALWVLIFSKVPSCYKNFPKKRMFFLFGSFGLVVLNSVALMTELIMKAVSGERLVGDLRMIVCPSEWVFTVVLLASSFFSPRKPVSTESLGDFQKSPDDNNGSLPTRESQEMESLGKASGKSEEQDKEII